MDGDRRINSSSERLKRRPTERQEASQHETAQQRLERNTRLLRTVSSPHGDVQTQAHPDLPREEAGTGQPYPPSLESPREILHDEESSLRHRNVSTESFDEILSQTSLHTEGTWTREQGPTSMASRQDQSSSTFLYLEETGTGQPNFPSLEFPKENLHDGESPWHYQYPSQVSSDIFSPTDEVLSLYAKETSAREQEPASMASRQDQSSSAYDNREARQEEKQRDLPSREIHQLLTPQEISLLQGTSTYPVRKENGAIFECRVAEGDPVYSLYAFIDSKDLKLHFTSDAHAKRYMQKRYRLIADSALELLPQQEAAAYLQHKKQSLQEALIDQHDTPLGVDRGAGPHASSVASNRQTISGHQVPNERVLNPESAANSRLSNREGNRPLSHHDDKTKEIADKILETRRSGKHFHSSSYDIDLEQLEKLKLYFNEIRLERYMKSKVRTWFQNIKQSIKYIKKGTTIGKENYRQVKEKAGKSGISTAKFIRDRKRKRLDKAGKLINREVNQEVREETGQSRDQMRAILQGQSSQQDDLFMNWPHHIAEPPLPDTLNGRRIRLHNVPGNGMNCLIYALLHAQGLPTRQRSVPFEQTTSQQLRTENIVEQTRKFLRTNDTVPDNTMLRADSIYDQIGSVVGYLRSQRYLHQDRGITIHRYRYNSTTDQIVLEANTILESSNQAPPIEMFLRETEQHFYSVQGLD